jgi:hypothetical protein
VSTHLRKTSIAGLVGLVGLAVLAGSVIPAGATKVCPPGISPPSPYCTNLRPVAFTGIALHVESTKAQLNGHAGPGVRNGDKTFFFFKYGRTKHYGKRTRTGKVPGHGRQAHVAAEIKGLTPNTTYHFRIFVRNADGKAVGIDRTFETLPR